VAGGAAGAAVGASQDRKAADQQAAQQAAAKAAQPDDASKEDIKRIGQQNYDALVALINYDHEKAYRLAMQAGNSKDERYREASYAVRALVDKDRGNADGMEDALNSFLELDKGISEETARKGLNDLHQGLEDERKAQGVWRKN
jgi:hypothetical protein